MERVKRRRESGRKEWKKEKGKGKKKKKTGKRNLLASSIG